MMASSAVYPTPSVGSAASWCWLPKSHLQEERYFKQLYHQKTPRDLSVQRHFNLQQRNTQPDDQLKRKYSHSFVSAPHRKQNLKSELPFIRNLNQNAGANYNSEVLKRTDLLLKSFPVKEPRESVVQRSGSLSSGPTYHTSFERTESLNRLQPQPTTKPSTFQESNESSQNSSASDVQRDTKKSKSRHLWMTNTLTCFLCQKRVKEVHFREHLFFGALKCSLCHEVFKDCQSFQKLMVDTLMEKASCSHVLEYSSDPFAFVGAMMSGEGTYVPGSLFPSKVLVELSLYIGKMRTLETKDPWKAAIAQCKRHLPSFLVNCVENTEPRSELDCRKSKVSSPAAETSNATPSLENHPRLIKDAPLTTDSPQKNRGTSEHGPHNSKNHFRTVENSLQETHGSERTPAPFSLLRRHGPSSHPSEEEDIGDLLLSQNYSLEHLEEAIEYVEVAGNCRTEDLLGQKRDSASKAWKKKRFYKKRKLPKASVDPAEEPGEANEEEDEISTEFVETPADGYYYVVRHAIEECPMCYTVLCPSRFTVNVVTFLITAVCTGCDLTIYIVPELPDGTTPGVSIVTEDPSGESKPLVKEKKKRGRRPKSVKPKKSLKSSKPQDFFCK